MMIIFSFFVFIIGFKFVNKKELLMQRKKKKGWLIEFSDIMKVIPDLGTETYQISFILQIHRDSSHS